MVIILISLIRVVNIGIFKSHGKMVVQMKSNYFLRVLKLHLYFFKWYEI